MCGIVGCAGASLGVEHERAFKDLLIVDTIRGPHSTGIMAASFDGVHLFKKALLPTDLFTMYGCQEIFKKQNHVLIGHNRWATKGAINAVNAHPFEFETLVGAHNGTLVNQRLLPDHLQFEVDSENIFHAIEKEGVKDTVAKLHGAYALTWYDKKKRSMNILRNKERPMFVTFTADEKVMFWASESWMLSGVLDKNEIEHKEIFDTKVDTHYEFIIPVGETKKPETYKLPKPIQRAVKPYEAPLRPKYPGYPNNIVNGHFMRNKGSGNKTNTPTGGNSWEYSLGETIHFYLDPQSPTGKPFILGMLAYNSTKKVKIFANKASWLRENLLCDDIDEVVYQGIVNGFSRGIIFVQENSVYTKELEKTVSDSGDIIQETRDAVKDMSPGVRNNQIIALSATGGTCSWCGDPITPNKEHVYLNSHTIICHICKDTDKLAKEFIKNTN